jgi:hypothetical protein
MNSSYSHFSKNRRLVGCITTLVGAPLMCCCLLGLFYVVFPMLEQSTPVNFPLMLVLCAAGALGILLVIALLVIFVYLRNNRH